MTTCRGCKFLDVKPDKLGRIIPRKDFVYRCTAPIPTIEDLGLPRSVTDYAGGQLSFHKSRMAPDWGADCPAFLPRVRETETK